MHELRTGQSALRGQVVDGERVHCESAIGTRFADLDVVERRGIDDDGRPVARKVRLTDDDTSISSALWSRPIGPRSAKARTRSEPS